MKPKRLLAFDGLEHAMKRASDVQLDGLTAYAPLTEALWWIDYLSESFRAQDAGYVERISNSVDGRYINALEYARNRHTHNRNLKSMHWPDQGFDKAEGRWRWRNLCDIQKDEKVDRKGEDDYLALLEGRNVLEAYEIAQSFLLAWYDSLDDKGDD